MRRFVDETGREWLVRIDVAKLKRWRDRLGIDFAKLADSGFAPILTDPVRFGEVLYQTCRDQAERSGVPEEEFIAMLYGDTLEGAYQAWSEAVVDFFPNRTQREKLRASLVEARESQKESGRESAGVPASSESTPTATPSGN